MPYNPDTKQFEIPFLTETENPGSIIMREVLDAIFLDIARELGNVRGQLSSEELSKLLGILTPGSVETLQSIIEGQGLKFSDGVHSIDFDKDTGDFNIRIAHEFDGYFDKHTTEHSAAHIRINYVNSPANISFRVSEPDNIVGQIVSWKDSASFAPDKAIFGKIGLTNGDSGAQIRFGHYLEDGVEKLSTTNGTAFYIGGEVSAPNGELVLKIATNGGDGVGAVVEWGDPTVVGNLSHSAISFSSANQSSVDKAVEQRNNGDVFWMDGIQYRLDSTATIANGASYDGAVIVDHITPEHFGAVGDGVTNDKTSLENAMNHSVMTNTKLIARGDYSIGSQIDVAYIGDLDWDFRGATIRAASGFAGSGQKMIEIEGATGDGRVFNWVGGNYNCENQPAEGQLSTNDMISISTDDSASVVRFHPDKLYAGKDWRFGGGDTLAFINADRTDINIGHAQGAVDLAVYISSSSSSSPNRQEQHVVRGNFNKCNRAVALKRGTKNFKIDIQVSDCFQGFASSAAEIDGITPENSASGGIVNVTATRTQWPINESRAVGTSYRVVTNELGVYLPSESGKPEVSSTSAESRFQGCKYCLASIVSSGVNPLILAANGNVVPNGFTAVQIGNHVGTNDTVESTHNQFNIILGDDVPRTYVEQDSSNHNVFVVTGKFAPGIRVGANSVAFNYRSWLDFGDIEGSNITLSANNNGGVAGNTIEFIDEDGSTVAGQPLGGLSFSTNGGGSLTQTAAFRAVAADATGKTGFEFWGGANGSMSQLANVTWAGDFELVTPDKGIVLSSPNGSRWKLKVDNSGALITTSI